MSARCETPMPTEETVRRLKKHHVRRRRVHSGRKHIPPIPGEYLYYDKRLEDSGYWTIGSIPCHFSYNGKRRFGPFVTHFGRHKGVRSEYNEIDAPDPRARPRPAILTPADRSVSPDFPDTGPRVLNFESDEDERT